MKRLNLNIDRRIDTNARKLTVLPQHARILTMKKHRKVDIAVAFRAALGIGAEQYDLIHFRKGGDGAADGTHLRGMFAKYPFKVVAGFDHFHSLFRRAFSKNYSGMTRSGSTSTYCPSI